MIRFSVTVQAERRGGLLFNRDICSGPRRSRASTPQPGRVAYEWMGIQVLNAALANEFRPTSKSV